MKTYILGISAFYHDSAACLIENGVIVAAAQEERFSRIKHDASFPKNAINFCLSKSNISKDQLSFVVFYEKPFLKFERLLETYLAFAPRGFKSFLASMQVWLKEKIFQKKIIIDSLNDTFECKENWNNKLLFSTHHLSHAASAFFPSSFDEAAILTLDGVGEWTTTSIYYGYKNKIELIKEIKFPHSLGLLYSAFTYYLGFKVNSGEYKVMGLAPYGEPKYYDLILKRLIHVADDGSFQLNMNYFNFATGLTMTNNKFNELFEGPPRSSETKITQREMDLAASIQKVIEYIIVKIAKYIKKTTGQNRLCLSGGVALNCVANGLLIKENIFEDIWIQPAAGDAGGALGAALSAWYLHLKKNRKPNHKTDGMFGALLGPEYLDIEIEKSLIKCGANFTKLSYNQMIDKVSNELSNESAVGWMQGRMEFGPRALGSRSIIADPRSKKMQKQLNLKVKFRESFRPFAPSIIKSELNNWFDLKKDSPYMLLVADVKKEKLLKVPKNYKQLFGIEKLNIARSLIPAVTHVDLSARVQTVDENINKAYYDVINAFAKKTGCPILVNTSFNVRGEPIICSPEDAFRCFMGTDLDILVIGNYFLTKKEQNKDLLTNYMNKYDLD
tara:strand:- start:11106 stop:12950 length:1845 start_codon:yes stop_codon:yes gene_type:complete